MPRNSAKRVKIDPQKFKNWCAKNGVTYKNVSENLGCYDSFISRVVASGEFPERKFTLFLSRYNEDEHTFLPDKAEAAKEYNRQDSTGFSMGLIVKPNKVRVSIQHDGNELYGAYAGIKKNDTVSLIQAISYAAHMCYKMAEQQNFEKD